MSDYGVPSQFVDEAQNEENFDDLLDLELFGDDNSGADIDGEQDQNLPEESINRQDVAPSGTSNVQEQQQEVPSNPDVQPPLTLDDFFEPEDFVPDPEDGATDEALGGAPSQAGLPHLEHQPQPEQRDVPSLAATNQQQGSLIRGDDQAHPQSIELGAADPSSIGLPTDGLTNLEQIPAFDFGVFDNQDWRDYANAGADRDIDDILGDVVREEQQPQVHEQEKLNYRQENVGQDVGRPGPGMGQGTSRATTIAARHPLAEEHADIDDIDDGSDESESSAVSDEVEYEIYMENDPLIVEDPPKDRWGRTGKRDGQEVWFNPEESYWQPSASHHDMRATLIATAQAEYPNDRYLHPDPTDGIPHGETAFFKPHQYRGPNRSECADELFVWREYHSKKDENGKPLRKSKPKIRHPGFMFEGDKILLDPRNNPVVNHKFIPLTLAVHTDGGKLQEMALKPGCRQLDLWARMPRYENQTDKDGNSTMVPLKDKNTRINMPMTRFREKKGTIAGSDREGTSVIMDGLRRFYHHNGFNPVAAGNSVKSFHRDLVGWEVKEVRLGNTSQFGRRAGRRALDDEARAANMEKTLKTIENGKKKQAANDGDGADQPAAPASQYGQNDFGSQPDFTQQQDGHAQARGPLQVQYSAYGPASFTTPDSRRTQQDPHGGVDMQATRSPYIYAPAPAPLNNSLLNSDYYPEDQYPRFNTGVQSFGPRGPQQTPHRGNQVLRDVSNTRPGADFPRPAGNSLAPGGRGVHQVPQQVLGKRTQQDARGFENAEDRRNHLAAGAAWGVAAAPNNNFGPRDSAFPIGSGQENLSIQADSGLYTNPEAKRRKHNPPPVTEPRQQHQRPHVRTSRLGQYGAGGAPTPLMPTDAIFGGAQAGSNPLGNVGDRLKSPGTIARELGDILQGPNPRPTPNGDVHQGTHVPRRHEPRQVLGKHGREDPMGRWGEEMYAPHQNLGQQNPGDDFGNLGQDTDAPGPKRRRMTASEGHHAPPVQAPPARPVKKARRREQNTQPPSLQLNTNQPIPNSQQTPQVLGAVHIPPQNIYTTNTPAHVGGPTQVFDPLGLNPPQLPVPPQTYTQAPTDIRDVRPANGDESQSLDSALRYTREAFREWTGLEAPVTNLEDSYNVQYREIRGAFRAWWRSEGNPYRGNPLPELWRALRWSGGMDDWDAPEDGEHLREARRNGKKAA